jgi:hypothetical protein
MVKAAADSMNIPGNTLSLDNFLVFFIRSCPGEDVLIASGGAVAWRRARSSTRRHGSASGWTRDFTAESGRSSNLCGRSETKVEECCGCNGKGGRGVMAEERWLWYHCVRNRGRSPTKFKEGGERGALEAQVYDTKNERYNKNMNKFSF